ncbi:MBL fold metallo-hydrolase [Gulbenkiania mobilis]|uniref:MBL fold metallo-hydrolase n=1 Tax=Gulbenkiania mobilis TaxID=397457 RepID=UPI0009F8BF95|nr:MBL fold metallo-hydrolase [Gulbenkiania mobilis]
MPSPTHRRLTPILAALVLAGCGAPYQPLPGRPHHGPEGYRNLYDTGHPERFAFLRWQWQRHTGPVPVHHPERIPRVSADLAAIHAPHGPDALTWIGHASMLLRLDDHQLLIDPVFSTRASPVSWAGPERQVPLPLATTELPHIDGVLISHNHYDHLDRATIKALVRQPGGAPAFVVPLGLRAWLVEAGVPAERVQEIDWWERTSLAGLSVTATPAQHWSKRSLWGDTNRTLWAGFAIRGSRHSLWYSGDTGYAADLFADIGRRIGVVDMALIPVGAYAPRWFMKAQHVNPDEAVRIFREVGARRAIGVHWGTFLLTDEPIEQPMADLAAARQVHGVSVADFSLMAIGETRPLP